jgi:protocatechuate 3,4-dioxygenase alpha subunit
MPDLATANQTVGPYFHIGLSWLGAEGLAPPGAAGERFSIAGRVLDGDGKPVDDAVLEIWRADAEGRYAHPEDPRGASAEAGRRGFGRVWTDADGAFRFETLKPGRVPGPGGRLQAPHLLVAVFMRGLLRHLVTRIYFPGDGAGPDPILELVEPARRGTLVARPGGGDPSALEWNVVLQGEGETVFFDC